MRPLFEILLAVATGAAVVALVNRNTRNLLMTEREAIDTLRGSVDTLKSDLDAFEASHGDTGELQKQLDAANQALTEAGHEIVTLQTQEGLDQAQISDLTGKLADAQTAIDAAKAAADENTGLLGNLKDAVDAMDATLKQSPAPSAPASP